jgi:hypothetical protein
LGSERSKKGRQISCIKWMALRQNESLEIALSAWFLF